MTTRRATAVTCCLIPILLGLGSGCGPLATSPNWVGGNMTETGARRLATEEREAYAERARLASQPDLISARHILVMHQESQSKPETVTRTRDQARARAQEALVAVRGGADFAKTVATFSDEPGAADRGGDLGEFKRQVMVKEFSNVAFSLAVGEISEVVETVYGFHVIKRTK